MNSIATPSQPTLRPTGRPAPSTVPTPIDRTLSPVEQAYQYILNGILSGELTPGMRVPSETIADALGISRMPVRDALRSLEGAGVVTIFANRGAAVAKYSQSEVTQLIEMRAVLEGLAARLALPNIGPNELEELDHLRRKMLKAVDSLGTWMALHDEFHNYLTSLSQRALLLQQTERMRLMLLPYYRRYYAQSREMEINGSEHQKILSAIEHKDPTLLEQIVRGHALINVAKVAELA
ncbi:GntR family transcriptional regulator [Pusillimonas sp. CC-YST705]|uniref:GntR family transcriptional regulator n=1 Tax=Mesopusillimonas faecipullorum TaxID=2755040 RepID=A0ABS8CAH3_9BURK|nr:GntR family transcriptional regulator [Mesopusillimonas faecipullorum]MCB5363008.1 GntR family transcriptional regulator [Mesopusillimonas faecipullorum]